MDIYGVREWLYMDIVPHGVQMDVHIYEPRVFQRENNDIWNLQIY